MHVPMRLFFKGHGQVKMLTGCAKLGRIKTTVTDDAKMGAIHNNLELTCESLEIVLK